MFLLQGNCARFGEKEIMLLIISSTTTSIATTETDVATISIPFTETDVSTVTEIESYAVSRFVQSFLDLELKRGIGSHDHRHY